MRHGKHGSSLGVKKEHRKAMMTSLAAALLQHGRIETTLAKAKSLRPFAEKVITLAKKADSATDAAKKLHYRRLAYARMQNRKKEVDLLFEEKVSEFVNRDGGYTRIYKLMQRVGDGAEMALIELVDGSDEGYKKRKGGKGKKQQPKKGQADEAKADESETPSEEPKAEEPAAEEEKKEG